MYNAVATWIEAQLRLEGIICWLSAEDLEVKEKALQSAETDRTIRCMEVLKSHGMISEDDFKNQVMLNCFLFMLASHWLLQQKSISQS